MRPTTPNRMMKRLPIALLPVLLLSCAHLPGTSGEQRARGELWHLAHTALYTEAFSRADSLFSYLAVTYPHADEGREALFYLGALHLDPRNEDWSSERSETYFRHYLTQDTLGTLIHRRPEAITILELATQLNLPPDQRVAGLQPGTRTVLERVVAPVSQQREIAEENERLRRMLVERDEQIRRQREELERIRRTLTPRSP
jgi:hypothetical protein